MFHLRREYRLVKVDCTAGQHDLPREFLVAQNTRVPLATWGQVALVNEILDIELIFRSLNLGDPPLHSKRHRSSGKHGSGVALTKMYGAMNIWCRIIAVGRM